MCSVYMCEVESNYGLAVIFVRLDHCLIQNTGPLVDGWCTITQAIIHSDGYIFSDTINLFDILACCDINLLQCTVNQLTTLFSIQ